MYIYILYIHVYNYELYIIFKFIILDIRLNVKILNNIN